MTARSIFHETMVPMAFREVQHDTQELEIYRRESLLSKSSMHLARPVKSPSYSCSCS